MSGIYGMNLEWLPAASTPYGFFVIVGIMAPLVAGDMLLFFRRQRLSLETRPD
ncbi:MAG: hypothetical protein R2844_17000 [Caldilineales bacterium]